MKEAFFIIDGYNVINSWEEFRNIRNKDLDHARELLVRYVSEYAVFLGLQALVVFDAMEVSGAEEIEEVAGLKVIFTAEHETADTWIERAAYKLAKSGAKVFVVTSDYAEQNSILGSGAYRVPSREFRENFLKTKKQIAEKVEKLPQGLGRHEVGGRLGQHVLAHLEKMRRK